MFDLIELKGNTGPVVEVCALQGATLVMLSIYCTSSPVKSSMH